MPVHEMRLSRVYIGVLRVVVRLFWVLRKLHRVTSDAWWPRLANAGSHITICPPGLRVLEKLSGFDYFKGMTRHAIELGRQRSF
ncbi:uncharacterized protein G2W53_010127 [Senna tora]|uniref:Uncharacterized protein n=1 Tax=Senna tora TaxID=362788 RepID=A0A834WZD2_9FABA|nr:uncharacterized protein G2W53_010127 [Senna tora]